VCAANARCAQARAAADERAAALAAEWASLAPALAADAAAFPPAVWHERAFGDALAVVLSAAVLLPAAECFALLPLAGAVRRRAPGPLNEGVSALLDYDAGRGGVVLLAQAPLAAGAVVVATDTQMRSNADLLLGAGEVDADFPGDYLTWNAALVGADRLYAAKAAALASAGLAPDGQTFPVYADRFPTQLLAYLRLSRVTDVAEMAKVRFEADAVVSQLNEYEVLQLMLGDCRERMAGYAGALDEEVKLLQDGGLAPEAHAAAALRLSEKRILSETMAAVRRRLAPIRGTPTKGGKMEAPNADILEIFEQLENLNKAPRAMFNSMFGWDDDGNIKPPKSGCS
jgi:histone-lysine N-methyltransferase SETD3